MSQTPSNPNQPPQSPFWGNMQPPQQGQSFSPQYPSGQYPPVPQQGYPQPNNYFPQGQYPQQGYPQSPMMQPAPQPPPKKKSRKGLIIGVSVLIVALALCGIISSHSATATPSSQNITQPTNTPAPVKTPIPQVIHYPPTTVNDLRGLAAQGNASAIHGFHSESVGLTGACPQPKREVTVDPSVTGKQLTEDLLAYFYAEQLDNPCGALVLAYHNQSEVNDPNTGGTYTAGLMRLDVTDSTGANNVDPNATGLKHTLTLDIGELGTDKEYVVTY